MLVHSNDPINRRWKNSLNDVRVYRGADVGSDHNLAVSTVRLSLAALKKQKKQLRYDTANLLNRDILTSFNATIGGKSHALADLDEVCDVDDKWTIFSSTINSVATEHLGHRKGKRDEWISTNSRDLIAKRKAARPALGDDYHELNRQTKASLRRDKKAWRSKTAVEMEEAAKDNNMREVYQKKNILLGKTSKRASQIRDDKGDIIKDEAARLKRWAEYFEGLLNADEPEETIDFSAYTVPEELDINMEPPSREELDKAISLLKRNKAPGVDNITAKILKDGGDIDAVREWLLRICQLIWETESTPAEWSKGIILPLPEKGDLSYCSNNRGITLLDVLARCSSQSFFSELTTMLTKRCVRIKQALGKADLARIRSSV